MGFLSDIARFGRYLPLIITALEKIATRLPEGKGQTATVNEQEEEQLNIQRMAQFLSTEHFTLQGARSGTISEANGRSSGFLTAVSGSLVALGFIAQISGLGEIFTYFALILFPALLFLGISTYVRLVQLAIADALYTQAITRIRHFYVKVAPDVADYLSFPHYDDAQSLRSALMVSESRWQPFFSSSGQISVINSVIAGVFAAMLVNVIWPLSVLVVISVGLLGLAIVLVLHTRYSGRQQDKVRSQLEFRFPRE